MLWVFNRMPYALEDISSECPAVVRLVRRSALLSVGCFIRLPYGGVIACMGTDVVDRGRLEPGGGNANSDRDALGAPHRAPRRTALTGPKWTAVQTDDWEPCSAIGPSLLELLRVVGYSMDGKGDSRWFRRCILRAFCPPDKAGLTGVGPGQSHSSLTALSLDRHPMTTSVLALTTRGVALGL
jgi:hypothetical protein